MESLRLEDGSRKLLVLEVGSGLNLEMNDWNGGYVTMVVTDEQAIELEKWLAERRGAADGPDKSPGAQAIALTELTKECCQVDSNNCVFGQLLANESGGDVYCHECGDHHSPEAVESGGPDAGS